MNGAALPKETSDFRDRLCDAAEHLFSVGGLRAVTVTGIAAELGCDPVVSSDYLRDDDALLAAVRTRAFDRFSDALEFAFHHTAGSRSVRSQAVARAYVSFALAEPIAYRLMFDIRHVGKEAHPDLVTAIRRARGTMTEHMQMAPPASEPDAQSKALGSAYWAAIHGVIMLHLSEKLDSEIGVGPLIKYVTTSITAGHQALEAAAAS